MNKSLATLQTDGFSKAAIAYLATLGYSSDLAPGGQTGDVDQFITSLKAPNPGTKSEQELRNETKSIHVLFQITDRHIYRTQPRLMDLDAGFDAGLAKTFLFFAIELKGTTYSRSEYARLTREINKRLGAPAVILFRAASGRVTLAFVHRRASKVRENRTGPRQRIAHP